MDVDALRLMVQGMAGRVLAVEVEVRNLHSYLAALIVEPSD
jgi:hypothetical protein